MVMPGTRAYTTRCTVFYSISAAHHIISNCLKKLKIDAAIFAALLGVHFSIARFACLISVLLSLFPPCRVLTSGFDSENYPIPLDFTPLAINSRLLGDAPPELFDALANEPITMNAHHDGAGWLPKHCLCIG